MYCSLCNEFDNKYARKYLWHAGAPRFSGSVYTPFFLFNLKENPSEREHDGARTEARAILILYSIPR